MQSHNLTKISPSFPPGFDPNHFPIIALHFFGVILLPRPDAVGGDDEAGNFDEVAA